mmetsp:Transcript_10125/g.17003  ORF Transcript_10125/g.17003 Transcript_10125/m.17003 type:complete len:145 (-) Transcript_10125:1233-1667(-)
MSEEKKLDRLVELRQRVYKAVATVEKDIAIAVRVREINGETITDEQADEYYLQRLDAGLETLQQCDLAFALASLHSKPFLNLLRNALKEKDVTTDELKEIIYQFGETLTDDVDDEAQRDIFSNSVRRVADALSSDGTADDATKE